MNDYFISLIIWALIVFGSLIILCACSNILVRMRNYSKGRPIAIDLFSGAGGFSLGFEASGFDIALALDIDPIHCATHVFNFPYSEIICNDSSKVTKEMIEKKISHYSTNEVDVIIGGPPCQGFSNIGYRIFEDPRNKLILDYYKIIKDIKPKYFVFENVPGIITGKHKEFINKFIECFVEIGYNILNLQLLNAVNYGVAQNRKRFILMGWRKDCNPIAYPTSTHNAYTKNEHQQLPLAYKNKVIGVKEAIMDFEKIPTYIGKDLGISPMQMDYSDYRTNFSFNGNGAFSLCHRRNLKNKLIFGHIGSKHKDESIKRFLKTEPGKCEQISRLYKLHPEKPCHTLRAGTSRNRGSFTAPRPIHYEHPRCISIREGARLHSYPDWFQFHRTIWHGFRQIGNSVAPIFAKALGDKIIEAMGVDITSEMIKKLPESDQKLLSFSMNEACNYFGIPYDTVARAY